MNFYRSLFGSVRLSLAAILMASSVLVLSGCGPTSVAPEDEVPAEGVPTSDEATTTDPAAVEGAETPAN